MRASHLGMGVDPAVLWVVADRLAQTRDGWQPFRRPTGFGLATLFPADDAAGDPAGVRSSRGR